MQDSRDRTLQGPAVSTMPGGHHTFLRGRCWGQLEAHPLETSENEHGGGLGDSSSLLSATPFLGLSFSRHKALMLLCSRMPDNDSHKLKHLLLSLIVVLEPSLCANHCGLKCLSLLDQLWSLRPTGSSVSWGWHPAPPPQGALGAVQRTR